MMVASYSFRHLVLLAVLTSFSSEVSAIASSKGGKGRSRSGRYDDTFSYNPDPEEENVDSPPVDIARFEPTAAPSGKPSQTPMCDHASELPSISPTTFHSLSPSATPTDSSLPTVARRPVNHRRPVNLQLQVSVPRHLCLLHQRELRLPVFRLLRLHQIRQQLEFVQLILTAFSVMRRTTVS